jgi:hypothetical protein
VPILNRLDKIHLLTAYRVIDFNNPIPALVSSSEEGYLMRNALLDDLSSIADLELFVLQDVRLSQADLAAKGRWQTIIVAQQVALQTLLLA